MKDLLKLTPEDREILYTLYHLNMTGIHPKDERETGIYSLEDFQKDTGMGILEKLRDSYETAEGVQKSVPHWGATDKLSKGEHNHLQTLQDKIDTVHKLCAKGGYLDDPEGDKLLTLDWSNPAKALQATIDMLEEVPSLRKSASSNWAKELDPTWLAKDDGRN